MRSTSAAIRAILDPHLDSGTEFELRQLLELFRAATDLDAEDLDYRVYTTPTWEHNVRSFLGNEQNAGRVWKPGPRLWQRVPLSAGWNLVDGDVIRRKELHDRFGGGRQGGI